MIIGVLFCLFAVSVADNYDDEPKNLNYQNVENEFDHRPIFPFDAFGLGYEKFFKKSHPPLLSAMNKYFRRMESVNIGNHGTAKVVETSHTIESDQSSSESDQSKDSSSRSVFQDKRKRIQYSSSESESSSVSSSMSESTSRTKESKVDYEMNAPYSVSSSEIGKTVESISTTKINEKSSISGSSDLEESLKSESTSESGSTLKSNEKSEIFSGEVLQAGSEATASSSEKHEGITRSHTSDENSEIETSFSFDKQYVFTESEVGKQSKSESDHEKSSWEKGVTERMSQSSDISSGAVVFDVSTLKERESESNMFSVSSANRDEMKEEITNASSDGKEIDSTKSESNEDSFTESKDVSESRPISPEKEYSGGSNRDSPSEIMFREGDSTHLSAEGEESLGHISVYGEVASEVGSLYSKAKEYKPQYPELGHHLTIPEVRKRLEDSYEMLGKLKKRLHRKENVINELNQVIWDLELLCEKICQEVPVKYLVNNY